MTLTGAYGRKYKNMAAALKDWESGKDFYIHELGCYCSIRDKIEFIRRMAYIQIKTDSGYLEINLE